MAPRGNVPLVKMGRIDVAPGRAGNENESQTRMDTNLYQFGSIPGNFKQKPLTPAGNPGYSGGNCDPFGGDCQPDA